jgi:hypothetical protein
VKGHADPGGDPAKLIAFGRRLVLAQGDDPTDELIGLVLGVDRRTITRWRNHPGLSVKLDTVDAIATRHGLHYSRFLHDGAPLAVSA